MSSQLYLDRFKFVRYDSENGSVKQRQWRAALPEFMERRKEEKWCVVKVLI